MVYPKLGCWLTAVCLLVYFAANRGTQCSMQVRSVSFMAVWPWWLWVSRLFQLIESHYIKDAQWFSVSVGGQCIFFRNPVKIQNYVFTFLFIPKRKQCKRCLELFSVPRRPLTANTQCFVLVFIFSIISSLTSNKHPTSSSSNCHLSFFFL